MKRLSALWSILLLAACATSAPPPVTTPVPASDASPSRPRHAVRPVPFTRAMHAAIERGTRTATGVPGPRYWQQRVNYRIDAELDPAAARLNGSETIIYQNNSPDTLREVRFLIYQNAFAEGVPRTRRVPITGGTTLEHVAVEGRTARPAAVPGSPLTYAIDGTQMRLGLPRPLLPGSSTSIDIAWTYIVPPRGAPRTGHIDNELFVVAQWYPQVATYDDLHGWHPIPYWTNGEFYLEYGDFDVTLNLPEGWIVDGTGTLQNADDVLTFQTRERLARALAQDSIVNVVTAEDLQAGVATERSPSGQLAWRFLASNVRDFAFAASASYAWDATRALLPDADADGRQEIILVNALYRPQFDAWREAARYTRHAVSFHADRWHPYIYPKITAAEGPIGGMEYPMIVFIGSPPEPQALYGVISHEVAHEWYPMMVGSNESRFAWQDEGLVTYVEDLSVAEYFPRSEPARATQQSYLRIAGSDIEKPIMTAPDLFGVGPQYGVAAYTKPGTLLQALGVVIGEERVHRSLRLYAERWLLKHPTPWDFFATVEEVAGRDLDWFWHPWFFETATLDQAVSAVTVLDGRVEIVIEDLGTAPMPAPVRVTYADGTTTEHLVPVEPWLAGHTRQSLTLDARSGVARVEIDAGNRMPDVAPANNTWIAGN